MSRTATDKKPSAWRSPWLIGWIGLLVMFLLANLGMIYFAIKSNPGLVVEDYYERGQNYERTIVSKMARDPGWLMNLDVPEVVTAGQPHSIRVVLVDRAGQPASPDQVTFFAYRPSDIARDFSHSMKLESPGRYQVAASFPLIGVWDLLVSAKRGAEEYTLGQRIDVARPEPGDPNN